MDFLKKMLLPMVKSVVLSQVGDLAILAPMLSKVLVDKGNIPQAQADALAQDLVAVVETEITTLVNKI